MHASNAPNPPAPGTADPYTFGGIADGTGGAVVATTQTMETETYSGPKFKQIAGKDGFTSMTGHRVSPAKASEISGDYQPLPHEESVPMNGENPQAH